MNPESSLNQSSTAQQIKTTALYSLPTSFYRWQVFGLLISGLVFLWLSRNEQLDWAISNYWYDAASGHFPWQNNYWLDLINHRLLKQIVIVGAVLTLFWGIYRRSARLIVSMLLLGIGPLVVGILKATSAHSCPWDLIEYGGKAMSFPLFGAVPALPVAVSPAGTPRAVSRSWRCFSCFIRSARAWPGAAGVAALRSAC